MAMRRAPLTIARPCEEVGHAGWQFGAVHGGQCAAVQMEAGDGFEDVLIGEEYRDFAALWAAGSLLDPGGHGLVPLGRHEEGPRPVAGWMARMMTLVDSAMYRPRSGSRAERNLTSVMET